MQKTLRQQSTPNDAVVGKTRSHVTSHNNHYVTLTLNRGSYMSAYVLLNLLNELEKKIRCDTLPSILSVFNNEFNKFNNTGTNARFFLS